MTNNVDENENKDINVSQNNSNSNFNSNIRSNDNSEHTFDSTDNSNFNYRAQSDVMSTQVKHPWRATMRTVVAAVIACIMTLGAVLPAFQQTYGTNLPPHLYEWLTLASGAFVTLAGLVTRILAMPIVESLMSRLGLGSIPRTYVR